jgi:YHS domain-containing protein
MTKTNGSKTEARPGTEKAIDPVCGMEVDRDPRLVHPHLGRSYWFCGEDCKLEFQKHPERFVHPA